MDPCIIVMNISAEGLLSLRASGPSLGFHIFVSYVSLQALTTFMVEVKWMFLARSGASLPVASGIWSSWLPLMRVTNTLVTRSGLHQLVTDAFVIVANCTVNTKESKCFFLSSFSSPFPQRSTSYTLL